MTIPYGIGPDAEVFKYSLFLVFCNRVVAASIAAITLVVSSQACKASGVTKSSPMRALLVVCGGLGTAVAIRPSLPV